MADPLQGSMPCAEDHSAVSRGTVAEVTRNQNNNRSCENMPPKRTNNVITSARYWDDLIGFAFGVRANTPRPESRASTVSSTSNLGRSPSNFSSLSRASSKTSAASSLGSRKSKFSLRRVRSSADVRDQSQSSTGVSSEASEGDEMRFFNRSKHGDSTVLRAVPEAEPSHEYFAGMSPIDKASEEVMSALSLTNYSSKQDSRPFVSPITVEEHSLMQNANPPPRSRQRPSPPNNAQLVGYWKDGEVRWVSSETSESSSSDEAPLPLRTMRQAPVQGLAAARQAKRPGIKLQIPAGIYTNPIPKPVPFQAPSQRNPLSPDEKGELRDMISTLSIKSRPRHPLESRHHSKRHDADTSSIYSSRTYAESIYPQKSLHARDPQHLKRPSMFSIKDPVAAGVFDDAQSIKPMRRQSTYSVQNPVSAGVFDDSQSISGYSIQDPVAHGVFDASRPGSVHTQVSRSLTVRSSMRKSSATIKDNRRLRKHMQAARKVFEQQLPSVPDEPSSPELGPPAIPARSRKRDWAEARPVQTSDGSQLNVRPSLCRVLSDHAVDHEPSRPPMLRRQKTETDSIYAIKPQPLSLPVNKRMRKAITPNAAQSVILNILENLDSFRDLASASRVNHGFYSVFRRFELRLIKKVMWNRSPAAWELRESSPKEIITSLISNPTLDYSPTRYMQFHTRDNYILQALKSLILVRCQSYLRPDTIMALRIPESAKAQEVDDALWRIWTFCTIFGSGKAREDDIQGQIDWLRGGVAAHVVEHNKDGSVDSNSILVNPPSYFAQGNVAGLSAEQIYDMTEMWNCVTALLSGIQGAGRTKQARKHGVFNGQRMEKDDLDEEELVLQEWGYYIATLGLSTVCDLAIPAVSRDETVFVVAEDMGWTQWHRPVNDGSRSNFLREALSAVYGERIAANAPTSPNSVETVEERRQRGIDFALELREKKQTSAYRRLPMSEERPMSMWMQWDRHASKISGNTPVELLAAAQFYGTDKTIERAPTPPPKEVGQASIRKSPLRKASSHGTLSLFPPQHASGAGSRPSTAIPSCEAPEPVPDLVPHNESDDSDSPVQPRSSRSSSKSNSGDSTDASSLHSQQDGYVPKPLNTYGATLGEVLGQCSVDVKLLRLVEMGFAIEDAKKALAKADDGSVIREDVAIERLLTGKF